MFNWKDGVLTINFSFSLPGWIARRFNVVRRSAAFGWASWGWRRGIVDMRVKVTREG